MRVTASLWIGIVALFVALASALFTWRQMVMIRRRDLRDRVPTLSITHSAPQPAPIDSAIYRVHLDGPEDLASVLIHKPTTFDGIIYPVALTRVGKWLNSVDIGPLKLGEPERITLNCGGAEIPPHFEVRVDCVSARSRRDRWSVLHVLPPPRGEDT